jgi:hypothetical protein
MKSVVLDAYDETFRIPGSRESWPECVKELNVMILSFFKIPRHESANVLYSPAGLHPLLLCPCS